jgi:hypothetical protein
LRAQLDKWMQTTGDPRANPQKDKDYWDRVPYFGAAGEGRRSL